jgi:hypothetical protein
MPYMLGLARSVCAGVLTVILGMLWGRNAAHVAAMVELLQQFLI